METILILLATVVALDLATWKWGFDSRDVFNSQEWERRHNWQGFH